MQRAHVIRFQKGRGSGRAREILFRLPAVFTYFSLCSTYVFLFVVVCVSVENPSNASLLGYGWMLLFTASHQWFIQRKMQVKWYFHLPYVSSLKMKARVYVFWNLFNSRCKFIVIKLKWSSLSLIVFLHVYFVRMPCTFLPYGPCVVCVCITESRKTDPSA